MTHGQRKYEVKQAKKHKMTLENWIKFKKKQNTSAMTQDGASTIIDGVWQMPSDPAPVIHPYAGRNDAFVDDVAKPFLARGERVINQAHQGPAETVTDPATNKIYVLAKIYWKIHNSEIKYQNFQLLPLPDESIIEFINEDKVDTITDQDTVEPVLVASNGMILDGTYRSIKNIRAGKTHVWGYILNFDIDDCQLESPALSAAQSQTIIFEEHDYDHVSVIF